MDPKVVGEMDSRLSARVEDALREQQMASPDFGLCELRCKYESNFPRAEKCPFFGVVPMSCFL
jgi:hypothetical protein